MAALPARAFTPALKGAALARNPVAAQLTSRKSLLLHRGYFDGADFRHRMHGGDRNRLVEVGALDQHPVRDVSTLFANLRDH